MKNYYIFTAIGLALAIGLYGIHYFIQPLSTTVLGIGDTIGAVFMIIGLHYYRKSKK